MRPGLIFSSVLLLGVASSQAAGDMTVFPMSLGQLAVNSRFLDKAVSGALDQFRAAAGTADRVTQADVDQQAVIERAVRRGGVVAEILRNDLNNDGAVTRDEVAIIVARNLARGDLASSTKLQLETTRQIDRVMIADANADGAIDLKEMLAAADSQSARLYPDRQRGGVIADLLAQDADHTLTPAEIEASMRAAFAAIDADGDGLISRDERDAYQAVILPQINAQQQAALVENMVGACVWPGLEAGADVTVITAHKGSAIADVTVADQDQVTGAGLVAIQPGDTPIYLLLSADTSVIWSLHGDVARVRRIALASGGGQRPSGIAGIDRAKVTLLAEDNCHVPGYSESASKRQEEAARRMLTAAGAASVSVHSVYDFYEISVPGDAVLKKPNNTPTPPDGSDPAVWQELLSYSPGGIVYFDPDTVVATTAAEKYDVLPQDAGLNQLVIEGVLARIGTDPLEFTVLKPMRRFPAGLAGALFVIYRQPAGFPVPAGNVGHSCLFDSDSSTVIAGIESICREREKRH